MEPTGWLEQRSWTMTGLVAKGAVVATLVLAVLHWASRGDAEPRPRPVSGPVGDTVTASFTVCGSARRFNCVVDGDTFWLGRQKIRIADIDAPELTPPRCEYEREVGELRSTGLGRCSMPGRLRCAGVRDEDPFGRKLRMVMRAGRSIGERMVAEGLVRRWDGNRRRWCD